MTETTVLLTDRAWPDDLVERKIIEGAGFRLAGGPGEAVPAVQVEAMVREYQPAAVMTCWAQVTEAAIDASPGLKVVTRLGVGLDNIAVDAATRRQVLVTNVPDYCVPEVSDHAVGMILAWTRGLIFADRSVRAGCWDPAGARLRRLGELTCGIVGYGRIGRATAGKLRAFGCRVLASTPHPPSGEAGVTFTDLDTLLARSDVVVLHAPLTEATTRLIGTAQLARMPAGGLLVNVSRGGLVDTEAVIAALTSGHLSGAALDVLDGEPEVPFGLREAAGSLITPHIAFSSDVSLIELRSSAAHDVVRVLRGEPARYPCNTPATTTRRRALS